MTSSNASPSVFGWDFQINAAILMVLENIQESKAVRVEGATEDIEITLLNHEKIYGQAKSVVRLDDDSHVIENLEKALRTLNRAARNGDGRLFTYVTNAPNPFKEDHTRLYFNGLSHLGFEELSETAQDKIKNLLQKNGFSDLDVKKLDVRVIPFYGDDLRYRYKEIKGSIRDFLGHMDIDIPGIDEKIMGLWQKDFFHNATQVDTSITITKEKLIWPLIVFVTDKVIAREYKKDFDEEQAEEIENQYKLIIHQNVMNYRLVSRVLSGFRRSKLSVTGFVASKWQEYLDIVSMVADAEVKESLVKIILYRILTQRDMIRKIKKGANL